jgi:hypothetical protein
MAAATRGARWTLPKLVDFDEAARSWKLDEQQPFKRPDWTYREPAAREPTAAPAPRPKGPVTVHLVPELAEAMAARARSSGRDLDHEIEAALRAWLLG